MAIQLLDLRKVTQPFDLATALQYMTENGEFIRCKTADQDFYMYRDVQQRPVIVNGRRQLIEVETVWSYHQWGGVASSINVSDLFNKQFYIMGFDETGQPDWSDPMIEEKKEE